MVSSRFCLFCNAPIRSKHKDTKYCSNKCQQAYQGKVWIEKWLSGEIDGFSPTDSWGNIPDRIRGYLFDKYNSKCALCGWGEMNKYTNKIPLEVSHIDGNYKNNRPENLILLCPNCHSLSPSHRGANRGNGRGRTWKQVVYDKL